MSLLEKASLIITPNSYKESKLYSVIPNTTLGDMDVVRATTATRVNASGLIESVGVNIPRIDYTNGSCPSLLVEPQRTNLLTYSEQIDNSSWFGDGLVVSANLTTSPSGIQNADLLTGNGLNTQHYILTTVTQSAKTYSVFAKMGSQRYIQILTGDTTAPTANFDLQDGVANLIGSNSTASIENYGNGWYRCILQTNDSLAGDFYINFANSLTMNRFGATLSNGTVYVWGAQAEVGSYATSYIPTVASSVTRNADVISKTGISSLIGQTEGTLFAEFYHNGQDVLSTQQVLFVSSGNTNNYLAFGVYDGRLNPAVRASSTDIFDLLVGPNPLSQGRHKVALAYKSGDFAVYLNGVSIYTNTNSATFGTMSQLDLGTTLSFNTQLGDGIKSAQLYKTRLSNSELAQLTTL